MQWPPADTLWAALAGVTRAATPQVPQLEQFSETLELTPENVETVLDEVRFAGRAGGLAARRGSAGPPAFAVRPAAPPARTLTLRYLPLLARRCGRI